MITGFERYTDETLLKIQANLLKGVTRVAESLAAGTENVIGPKGEAPPMQSGQTSLWFLAEVSLELAKRNLPSVAVDLDRLIRDRLIREVNDGDRSR